MDPHSISLITTLVLVFTAAIFGGIVARKLRLPMIIGYIAAGLVVGTLIPGLLARSFLQLIADTGVTLLLFTLGIEFSFVRLRPILRSVFGQRLRRLSSVRFSFFLPDLPSVCHFYQVFCGSRRIAVFHCSGCKTFK